ncbi:MAG: glycosyltransferase family 2 protein [Candidatus Micrarchaeia archaeon]
MKKSFGKVAIIIPALNEEKKLEKLLYNLTKNPYPDKEIIVVDGGSTDGTVTVARKFGCKVLHQKEKTGPAGARNQGARATNAPFLTFCDADFDGYNRAYFFRVLRHFKDPRVAGVMTRYQFVVHTWFERLYLKQQYFHYPSFAGPFDGTMSAAGAIRRTVFFDVGGFAKLGVGEDMELRERLKAYCKKKGLIEVLERRAIQYSNVPESFSEFVKSALWYGRTAPIYMIKTRRLEFVRLPGLLVSFAALVAFTVFSHPLLALLSLPFDIIALWFALLALKRRDWEYIPALALKLLQGVFFCIGILMFVFGRRSDIGRG